jgi:hypothetical protein
MLLRSPMSNAASFHKPITAELYFNGERLAAGQAVFDEKGGRFEAAADPKLASLPSEVVTLRVIETGDTYPITDLRVSSSGDSCYEFRVCRGE